VSESLYMVDPGLFKRVFMAVLLFVWRQDRVYPV